jgi:hypothetical protein
MYNPNSEMKVLTTCDRTGGFCNEDLDCKQYKEKDWKTGVETCPHKGVSTIKMPKRQSGFF